ncbi:MAG: hypothetical protein L7F77_10020 [Candidatus Magnetominusculus sp. LBB02]|nr:hypothetical protein [Candidatus Magnetominusculus sp. LBB02]
MAGKTKNICTTTVGSGLAAVIISTVICLSLSIFVRFNEYNQWKQNPGSYFVDGTPMMTTVDAFYWVRLAREYKDGTYYEGVGGAGDKLRYFPSGAYKPERAPLISILLAKCSGLFDGNLYLTGVYLIAVISGFFIVPLILYFGRTGFLSAGILGSLVGTFSFIYIVRTSAARVRPDSLNLFFPFLASYFILLTQGRDGRARPQRFIYLYSSLAGVTMMMMERWYGVSEFSYLYLVFLAAYLVINKNSLTVVFYSSLIFLYCSFPFSVNVAGFTAAAAVIFFIYDRFWGGKKIKPAYAAAAALAVISAAALVIYESTYLSSALSGFISSFSFILKNYFTSDMGGKSNALTQVTELQHASASEVFAYVIKEPAVSAIGFFAFIAFIFYNFKKALPILPVFFIGLMSFQWANRFAMYLAPFIGVGFGYLITVSVSALTGKLKDTARTYIIYISSVVFFIVIINQTAFFFVPQPALPVEFYRVFKDIKSKLHGGKPVILTWWDFGYALEDITGFATFHDGGIQHTEKTVYIAHAFTSTSQPEFYNITAYIAGNGSTVASDDITGGKAAIKPLDNVRNNDIYILYTSDMIGKFQAMYNVSGIDKLRPNTTAPLVQPLSCQSLKDDMLDCYEVKVNLKTGMINDTTPLKKAVFIDSGYIGKSKEYDHSNGLYLELFALGNAINSVVVVNDIFFNSNLNQMYLLGSYDKSLFEETYSALPVARLFRIKTPVM